MHIWRLCKKDPELDEFVKRDLVWDYAVNDFPNARRIMQRVTLQGDKPI